jgi:hypothetical protein
MRTSALLRRPARRVAAWLGGCLALVLALSAATAPSLPRSSVTSAAGELLGVAAVSPSDAWAVGDTPTSSGAPQTLVLHWNGSRWTRVPSPSPGRLSLLNAVSALSPSDAWAVGSYSTNTAGGKTLVLHWDGSRWTTVPSPTPEAVDGSFLLSVSALSSCEAWAAGWNYLTGGESSNTLVLRWNGTRWTKAASPNPLRLSVNELHSVSARTATDAWAVGTYLTVSGVQKTLILHWNGTRWIRTTSPSPGGSSALNGVSALSASSAWAVGSTGKTLILHWNGSGWAHVASPGSLGSELNGVSARSAHDAWAVGSALSGSSGGGNRTLVLHWNGTGWASVASPDPGGTNGNVLNGVLALSPANAWAVGSYLTGGREGEVLILHWNGTRWMRS